MGGNGWLDVDSILRPGETRTAVGGNDLQLFVPAPAAWINANDRMHWRPKARLTKAWRMAAHIHARVNGLPQGMCRVQVTAYVMKPTARAYDAHNLMPTAKAVMDGLVDYGLIPDDTNAHLVGPDIREGGKGAPGLRIVIETLLPVVAETS